MNQLEKLFAKKLTENGDDVFNTTGNYMLDILFMTEYYQKHLEKAYKKFEGRESDRDKLFSMFVRDPRYGLGRRDLGNILERASKVSAADMVKAGRYDDLLSSQPFGANLEKNIHYIYEKVKAGDALAKKWMPRLTGKDRNLALLICKVMGVSQKQYRKDIKVVTTESQLSEHKIDEINFEHVPSLAMIKYYSRFMKEPRFQEYIEQVKAGKKKINTSVVNVYDIYKNRDKIDADLFFDKLEKISISCIPILDTSGSMWDSNDSLGKAMSIAYYLAKCSTYCKNHIISFSSQPELIKIHPQEHFHNWYGLTAGTFSEDESTFSKELNSMYTGDCTNTDFGAVIKLLSGLEEFPDYFVVLSDMEFDEGSNQSKEEVMNLFESSGIETKIIWWNFNGRSTTVPELDSKGNVYMSGYSPMLLKYLESGFDGSKFLNKLLEEYKKNIEENN